MIAEAVKEHINYQVGSGAMTAGEADAFGWTLLLDKIEEHLDGR